MSEALILATRLLIELQVQYMKTTSSGHVVYTNCFLFLNWHSEQFLYSTCYELVIFMYWTSYSMNNHLSFVICWCKNKCFWKRFTCKDFIWTAIILVNKTLKLQNPTNIIFPAFTSFGLFLCVGRWLSSNLADTFFRISNHSENLSGIWKLGRVTHDTSHLQKKR